MPSFSAHLWKKAPFIRMVLPLMAGIMIQWHFQINLRFWWCFSVLSLAGLLMLFVIPFFNRFRLSWLNGIFINLLFIACGATLARLNDIRHQPHWLGHFYKSKSATVVTILEPLVEKTNSFKALATAEMLRDDKQTKEVIGNIILYFQKDSSVQELTYGSQIVFNKVLIPIKNSGNPGGFDYKRYCLFQQITHQVYLKAREFVVLPEKNRTRFTNFLYSTREKVLNILRTYIKGDKESGLAEALLIGYKDDLDKNLVQSYSNTGVVHVIAISGLHLGLIYWLLVQLSKPLRKRKNVKWFSWIIIIASLWLFSLLAGAQASVLRSAVMFTCIAIGESFARKISIFNTLALSAFLLLCYNPYWLWDLGFQLSYAAVLSLVIFMRPVYNWFYMKNRAIDFIWKLIAVTIAAQILTIPLSLYYFHQFPNFFLVTNLVAVPLSSIILSVEILLCAISFIPLLATWTGQLLYWLIWILNTCIELIDDLPFSTWGSIQISIPQTILLLIGIAGLSWWLLEKRKGGLTMSLIACLLFFSLRSYSFYHSNEQQKIIIYNIPKYPAIDIIDGRKYFFLGDSILLKDEVVRNIHLKPSRILHRVENAGHSEDYKSIRYFECKTKKIMLVNTTINYEHHDNKIPVDLMVISRNPKLYISKLSKTFSIKQIVFDGSVPEWKRKYWRKDCDSLRIPYHDVNEKGAFVMNLN